MDNGNIIAKAKEKQGHVRKKRLTTTAMLGRSKNEANVNKVRNNKKKKNETHLCSVLFLFKKKKGGNSIQESSRPKK